MVPDLFRSLKVTCLRGMSLFSELASCPHAGSRFGRLVRQRLAKYVGAGNSWDLLPRDLRPNLSHEYWQPVLRNNPRIWATQQHRLLLPLCNQSVHAIVSHYCLPVQLIRRYSIVSWRSLPLHCQGLLKSHLLVHRLQSS